VATVSRVDPRVSFSQFPVSLSIPREGHDFFSTSVGRSDRLPFTDSRTVGSEDGDSMLLRYKGNTVTGLISGGDIVVPRSRIFAYFFFYILKAIKFSSDIQDYFTGISALTDRKIRRLCHGSGSLSLASYCEGPDSLLGQYSCKSFFT
jgi:hypothetical protein